MARRKDLLAEAIADAKAVKETALANAKLALEEAFTPKLQSMISAKLAEEAEVEEEMDEELESSDLGAGDNAEPSDYASDSSEVENDDELSQEPEESENDEPIEEGEDEMDYDMEDEMDIEDDDMGAEMDMDYDMEDEEEVDLDLESVIAELESEMEEDMEEEMDMPNSVKVAVDLDKDGKYDYEGDLDSEDEEEIDLDEVIRTLKEMEEGDYNEEEMAEEEDMAEELEEAYKTIASLKRTINEVNLLNAKLLYTNKLFRTFDLNENQKVKVLENFDRTSSVREVKLVFSTLAENLNVVKKKKVFVKEGYASKPTKSSAPKKIISEGNELAARWKKLAGLK